MSSVMKYKNKTKKLKVLRSTWHIHPSNLNVRLLFTIIICPDSMQKNETPPAKEEEKIERPKFWNR